jgi:DNA-binding beta-propeller fold protein YncE
VAYDAAANEVFVADTGNRRIVVFDADKGTYKRHWFAYGEKAAGAAPAAYAPSDPPAKSFRDVTCVEIARDGQVYVCDRSSNRIQVFRKDGTFVKEFRVSTATLQNGSVWDLVLSEDNAQKFIFVADGANGNIVTLDRETGQELAKWGRHGRQPGQFKWVHNLAIDSKGNLYTAEVGFGRRAQKFRRTE